MVSFYKGNESGQVPGLLPYPPEGYYWWEAGAMFGALVAYWKFTGDTSYNAIITQAMLHQVGEDIDFAPRNQTTSLGNDDQAFWAMTALAAAEYNFPNPPSPSDPSWLGLAQAVFNEQIGRWDTEFCNGGLRWQVVPQNNGYNLKNSISNGALFNIAARLARYTKNPFYAEWAVKVWDWMVRIELIDSEFRVYDNAEAFKFNCTQLDKNQWSYNAATMIMGASTLYNYTGGDPVWRDRTTGLLERLTSNFFLQPSGIMREGCEEPREGSKGCNTDQKSFKAYLSRWLTVTSQMAPYTAPNITALLRTSAKAAAKQCTGGSRGTECGIRWDLDAWDGTRGVGQSMSALETVLGTLIGVPVISEQPPPPLTGDTGGTSISDPTAGKNSSAIPPGAIIDPATKSDRAGAWVLTVLIVLMCVGMTVFLWTEMLETKGASTVRGKAMKERGKEKDVERVIINLHTGKRRSVSSMGGVMEKAVVRENGMGHESRGSVNVLPKVREEI
ncbi:glycosyl hydrolase family 76-domain-containing protein [Amylocarpus encephaloides]|uniref:Mannan endo-1,6-alpha-mannosidase n=1 Tax=Amylocarpus encephaloides TaxID=45428 RepID=A0A9P7Y8M0_9HELO|nr:glycosyl hydrolase family 76-domain-containing protein [Amylocarpus encephaloides]